MIAGIVEILSFNRKRNRCAAIYAVIVKSNSVCAGAVGYKLPRGSVYSYSAQVCVNYSRACLFIDVFPFGAVSVLPGQRIGS